MIPYCRICRAAFGVSAPLMFLAACESNGGPSTFLETDSAGVLVAETPGPAARRPIGWEIDTIPTIQIGRRDSGESEYQFYRVTGIVRFSDGRVMVVDGGSREIRFFDPEGMYIAKTGREGRGPGEFLGRPSLASPPSSDSVFLFDPRLGRITVLDQDGEFRRTVTLDGRVAVQKIIGPVGSRFLIFNTLGLLSNKPGLVWEPEPAEYYLLDPATGITDTVGVFQGRQFFVHVDRGTGESATFPIPFDIMPSASVGGRGFFLSLGENQGAEILEFDTDGELHRIIRLNESPLHVSQAELDRFIEGEVTGAPSREVAELYEDIYRDVPIPERMPAFEALLVDDLGWLWGKVYNTDSDDSPVWLVFDRRGEGHGSVKTPKGLEVHQIGRDFLIGRWRDEFGVEYVRVHTLIR